MGDPIQGIRPAPLVIAERDSAPAKPPAKTKGVGQGSAAPTPPPPPAVKDPIAGSKGEIEIAEANKKRPRYEPFPLTEDNTRGVLQHEYSIVTSDAKQNQLAAENAGPCVIPALWNPDAKKAGLAHVDSNTNNASIRAFVKQVASGARDGTKIQVHLVAGIRDPTDLQVRLLDEIKDNPVLELVSADLGDGLESRSLAISAKTGKIHNSVDLSVIDQSRNVEFRLGSVEHQNSYLRRVPEQFFKHPEKSKDPR
jgi:Protein N-terminal asparagine amidohydrolase